MVKKVNLLDAANQTGGFFQYLKVGQLNNHVLHVIEGKDRILDFHTHEQSDELFYTIEGKFEIEFDDGCVSLEAGDMIIVPKGIRHRPVVTTQVKCLLVEMDGTLNAANTGGTFDNKDS